MPNKIIKINPNNPGRNKLNYAASILSGGGIVVFPTDTVYGLGAKASRKDSIRRIYRIKKRSRSKPMIYLIGYKKDVNSYVSDISKGAKELMRRFWPGSLTLIFNTKEGSQSGTIGLRMPANRIALALIRKVGAIAATSVNISGSRPIVEADDMEESLRKGVDLIIDGGKTSAGRESTVVDVTAPPFKVLRLGAIKKKELLL